MRPFRFLAFVPTIIVLVVITYLSLAKNPVHSQEFYLFEGADKLVHGCMYLGLVWIGCFDIYRVSKFTVPKLILLVCGAIVWGGLMELLQSAMLWVEVRTGMIFSPIVAGRFWGLFSV